ncbi:lipopolysaccharide modification acyltransferase [Segatella salivae]|uniref:lipopolysaccharide modification acyltransferase n=1 Tax=Segatella salivae TaxID=228604 RepID=UPI0028D54799|nr:lipopolysaccharide modification acyltransferase [Segatella salivae]
MNTSAMMNVVMMQRCKRCTFDSPGLASESEGYPGSFAVSGNNAVGIVPFIPHHFIAAFHAENVQHLRR